LISHTVGRLAAGGNRQPRQKATEDAVAHDQVGQRRVDPGNRMARRGGERQKRALGPHGRVDANGAVGSRDKAVRRPAEQALRTSP
jgi:hypothetical protein